DEDVPGRGDNEEDYGAGDGCELGEACDDAAEIAAGEDEVGEDDEDGEDDSDEALGEKIEGAANGEGIAEERVWLGLLRGTAFDQPVTVDGEREPEADHRVGDDDAGEDEDAEAGEKD